MRGLPPVRRPNGKWYWPRKVNGNAVCDENDNLVAVLVLGTHDVERARPLAEDCARAWTDDDGTAASPGAGWWRDGMRDSRRWWEYDEIRGRAGVWFEVVESESL